MASKLQRISELADMTANRVTRNAGCWMDYLDTASRLYKYSFDDQLLIYAQRPNATACASFELWNERMRRWVKAGSKGIALIRKDEGCKARLEYVFDVADTRPVRGAKMPYLWELREEYHKDATAALERRYGHSDKSGIGAQLMDYAEQAVDEVYRDYLADLRYDTRDSLLEELDGLNLEVRFRSVLTASVQYTLLRRCGLDPADYLEPEDFQWISEFSTPAVLHHLGDAASTVSMEMLNEIGRTVRANEREARKKQQNISQKPLAKEPEMRYTEAREDFSTLKRESAERSTDDGTDLHEGGGLPDPRSDSGRRERDGGNASGQVREDAGTVPEGTAPRDLHLHAADGAAGTPSERDRPAGQRAGGPDRGGAESGQRSGREDEGQGPDGLAAGGEQLHGSGGGNGPGGDHLQVNQEPETAAGEQPAVSASERSALSLFHLFPTVEEQVEAIAQASAEEQRGQQVTISAPVSDEVIDRALTSGGNDYHSIERIVAFFQKSPANYNAAEFLRKEYSIGGKGVTIDGQQYALWFDGNGLRIAPGRAATGQEATLVPWKDAANRIGRLLRDGQYAAPDRLDRARDNEFRELAESLWYTRQNFSDDAKRDNYFLSLAQAYVVDPISKKSKKNRGELPQYFVENTHEAIIPMEEWQAVQAEFKRRRDLGPFGNKALNTCCFTGKIKCPHCGCSYMHSVRNARNEEYWICGSKKKKRSDHPCPVKGVINHKVLKSVCAEVLGLPEFDEDTFLEKVDHIEVPLRATLDFYMKDGTTIRREAKSTGHQDCWTKEYREKVSTQRRKTGTNPKGASCFTAKIKCPTCGCNFRKQGSTAPNGTRVIYWRCADHDCGSKGLREDWLKDMCAEVMGTETFSATDFSSRIDHIDVSPDTELTFIFTNGDKTSRLWPKKKKGHKASEHQKEVMREHMKKRWTPEYRQYMSERMKQIRREKKWPNP